VVEQDEDTAEIAAALRLAVGRIVRKVRQAKDSVGNVALSEGSVLARLDRDGADFPGSLAALEGVRPQAMAATLAALEERGLIGREQDPSDGRRTVVTVTDAGRRIVADRRSVSVRGMTAALEQHFTPAERKQLSAVVPLLDRLADRL
jgi:DNA-binding MarR family transcriptional regulator